MKITVPKEFTQRTVLYLSILISATLDILFTCDILPNSNGMRALRYLMLVLPIVLCITAYLTKGIRKKFVPELKRAIMMTVVLLIVSLIKSINVGRMTVESFLQLFQIFIPFLYAYIVVNDLNERMILSLMRILLAITTIGYLIWIIKNASHGIRFSFSILGIESPFECGNIAEVASGLAAFFIYYRKKAPISCMIAVIMNLMISKRILIFMMLVLLICTMLDKQDDKISNRTLNIAIFGTVACVWVLYMLYQPENAMEFERIFKVSPVALSVGRVYRLWYCLERGFRSYGLASTTAFLSENSVGYLGFEFEMDLIRFMYELGTIAVAAFVYTYLKNTRNNKYCFILILFCLLNLLMANGIVKYLGYTYRLITIALINYGEPFQIQLREKNK